MSKSVMTHQFQQVPRAEIPRASFDRSHGHKTTINAGGLYPIYVDEALPGDTFNLKLTAFARLATPIKPIMDNMFMETFFFSVPYRLIWDNWERFNGMQSAPGASTDYTIPQVEPTTFINGSLADYFGIPTNTNADISVNALHFRAYNLIWNDWFRDQNLQAKIPVAELTPDGPDLAADYIIQSRRKRPDYFTSCLPFAQKGDPVIVPVGGQAPIVGLGVAAAGFTGATPESILETDNPVPVAHDFVGVHSITGTEIFMAVDGAAAAGPLFYADLANAAGVSINDLRQSFQIQKLLERDARGGTRYIEIVKSHFGVTSPDLRATRPEFLGGGSSYVNINPVEQTTQQFESATEQTPQGNLAAYGTVTLSNHGFTKSFTEHCLLVGLVNVRADLTYQRGQDRMWSRQTRYDYYWPALSHIGEQAVLQGELYKTGVPIEDDVVFGYQERYAEYRYKPSLITSLFRSNDPTSLDVWHLSQDFGVAPILNPAFIRDNPPIARIIAVPTEPHFLFDGFFKLRCARPIPLYGTPGMIDHF